MTCDCAQLSPRAATSQPRPSHEPFPWSLCRIHTSQKQQQRQTTVGCWNAKPLVAGGIQVARDTCPPSHPALPSCLWDVTSIFYLLSTPVFLLQDQQQPSSWLLGQERFWYTAGRWEDQQMTQLQLQPAAPLLILASLWCSCLQMEQFLSEKLQFACYYPKRDTVGNRSVTRAVNLVLNNRKDTGSPSAPT